ncbi:hypothetical protein B0H17DRAFT_1091315 [Mycena rosella]|uniref:F-box domain-containing protein n=1 Tax=Mycena rosella TaxID=1033263 RepID=A0AAD7CYR3_MYCRO|nr:hypothetical protein B0H17DRAFT_1091315 [Mycena rosella]
MEPLLKSLIHSNRPLDDFQTIAVRKMLGAAQTELSALEETILKVSLVLAELEEQKGLQYESIIALKAAVSPMRRIPPEILGEVFLLCRDNSLETASYSISDVREAPMLLTHTSSSWRSNCHQTPRLWNHIYLKSVTGFRTLRSLEKILPRSGNLPLYVDLETFKPTSHALSPEHVLNLLFRHHDRFRTLHIGLKGSNLQYVSQENRTLANLALVHIHIPNTDPDIASTLAFFKEASSIQQASIAADYDPSRPHSLRSSFCWSQLTLLELRVPLALLEARDILTQCKKLRMCHLSTLNFASDSDMPPSLQAFQLPDLHHLEIQFENDDADVPPDIFFQIFSFPYLQHLAINSMAWAPLILLRLYDRSQFKLQELDLRFLALSAQDLVRFIARIPSLQNLRLECCAVNDEPSMPARHIFDWL